MGLFDNTRDILNGFTPGRKKKYSPFLSSVLMYLSDFKISTLEEFGGEACVFSNDGNFQYEILVKKNLNKIDELRTTIFDHLTTTNINSVTTLKPLENLLTFELYKNSTDHRLYNRDGKFVELLSKRSYLRYLFNNLNKDQVERYIDIKTRVQSRMNSNLNRFRLYESSLFSNPFIGNDPWFAEDSKFKNVDNSKRIHLALSKNDLSSFSTWNPELNRQQKLYEATNGYKTMDVWYLKLTISKKEKILFEDIVLSNGKNGNEHNMHEDDFLYFSEAIGSMFERWEEFI
jgi:hypothetical protein